MMEASNMINLVQKNNGKIICCPEAIAYNNEWIGKDTLLKYAEEMKKNDYGKYLKKIAEKTN